MSDQTITTARTRGALGLAVGDALALLAFLMLGEAQHNMLGSPDLIPNVIRQLAAFGIAWFTLAWALRAFDVGESANWKSFLGRSLLAWLFAAPAGIALRAVFLGQASILMPFVFAATTFGGLILLAWRAAYIAFLSRRTRQQASARRTTAAQSPSPRGL